MNGNGIGVIYNCIGICGGLTLLTIIMYLAYLKESQNNQNDK